MGRAIDLDSAELAASGRPKRKGAHDERASPETAQQVGTPPSRASPSHESSFEAAAAADSKHSSGVNNEELAASDETYSTGAECGCEEHAGSLIVDEQFDLNVDLLFSLLFTNSKFMRAHMIRRGMTRSLISKWRRVSPGQVVSGGETTPPAASLDSKGTRSNSSTLSSRDGATSQQQLCHESQRLRQNSLDSLHALDRQAAKVRSEQERQLSYSMNVNHMLVKHVEVEERQSICLARSGQVYVLKSTTLNSGFPYSESFTIELIYCLTRGSARDRSRMKVHALVNFIKEKNNWRLSMIKPVLEKSSMQGVQEFVSDLGQSIRQFASSQLGASSRRKSSSQRRPTATGGSGVTLQLEQGAAVVSDNHDGGGGDGDEASRPAGGGDRLGERDSTATPTDCKPSRGGLARDSRSLTRAKSKLKERKLRHMYRYYIRADEDERQSRKGHGENGTRSARDSRHARHDPDQHQQGVSPSSHAHVNHDQASLSSSSSTSSSSTTSTTTTTSSTSSSSASSAPSSLLLREQAERDNDSMLIMMATTNDDDDALENHNKPTTKATPSNDRPARAGSKSLERDQRRSSAAAGRKRKHPTGGRRRSYVTKNLVMALGGGLLLLLTGAVFVLNALVLRRLDRLELTMRTILDSRS